jgi:hypothetical protein
LLFFLPEQSLALLRRLQRVVGVAITDDHARFWSEILSVECYWLWVILKTKILCRIPLWGQGLVCVLIKPSQFWMIRCVLKHRQVQMCDWTHLSIQKGVSQQ